MIQYRDDIKAWYPDYASDPAREHAFIMRRISGADMVLRYLDKRHRGLVVQAGGHIGMWPIRLSLYFNSVITAEPEPALFACLQKNVSQAGRVGIAPVECALGDVAGEVLLERHPSPGRCAVSPIGDVTVSQRTIDEIVGGRWVDAIVLDIEGYEEKALRGAVSTIARCNPVIQVEMLPRSEKGIDEFLRKLNYRQRVRERDAVYTR